MSATNGFYLKLRTKDASLDIRESINLESSFYDLLKRVSNAAGIQISNLKILSGFPRKALVFPATETLQKCGIKCGDTLFVAEEENFNATSIPTRAAQSQTVASGAAVQSCSEPSASVSRKPAKAESPISASVKPAKVESPTSASVKPTKAEPSISASVKPKADPASVSAKPTQAKPLPTCAKPAPAESPPVKPAPPSATVTQPESQSHITDIDQRNGVCGILMKKVVPSDNSCLFTSFEFVVSGKLDTSASSYMRQLVAGIISSQPEEYNEAVLGQPNEKYCKWIMNPNSWGGAIELAALSDHFGFEIAVVNSITGLISRFGEDKHYDQRVFLLFDGIHYDPLYMDFIEISRVQTIFPTSDTEVYQQAEQLAEEAKSSRQFTDVNQFRVRCTVCDSILVGQVEAQMHAENTGHTSFDEVLS